jgi:hypothetical protein
MPGYTPLGIEKIVKQAKHSLDLIRCPRDSVVMRILGGRAERRDGSGTTERFSERLPSSRYWSVREVDLECPACRRRAQAIGVRAANAPADRNARITPAVAHHV